MELFKAEKQWASRPADERFWNLEEMKTECLEYARNSVSSRVRFGDLRVEAKDGEMLLMGKESTPARVSHYSLGQLAGRIKAPADYIRRLPATLAAQNLNHGLAHQRDPGDTAKILLHKSNGLLLRCFTSDRYQRIWNYEIAQRLIRLQDQGWRTAPARPVGIENERTRIATQEDCARGGKLGLLSVRPGDTIAPAGLYASDRDMFVFLINDDVRLNNPADPNTPLARGFFIWNSEVGDKSFGIMTFLYDAVCGNHIVWGAQDVSEFRIIHTGRARSKAFGRLSVQLRQYAHSSVSDDEAKIAASQTVEIAGSKADVISAVLKFASKKRLLSINKSVVEESYTIAEQNPRYGNPNTPWAMAQGMTVISQRAEHASSRVRLDKAAGNIIEMAF